MPHGISTPETNWWTNNSFRICSLTKRKSNKTHWTSKLTNSTRNSKTRKLYLKSWIIQTHSPALSNTTTPMTKTKLKDSSKITVPCKNQIRAMPNIRTEQRKSHKSSFRKFHWYRSRFKSYKGSKARFLKNSWITNPQEGSSPNLSTWNWNSSDSGIS